MQRLSGVRYEAIRPLLVAQPYIEDVRWHAGEKVDHDFTNFRSMYKSGRSLAVTQAIFIGADPEGSRTRWLDVTSSNNGRVIIHRSPRYHNEMFPWAEVLDYFGKQAIYCGLWDEFQQFVAENGHCEFYQPKDYLELAQLISGSELFIGNQSSPYAVAEGLKHNSIQETHDRNHDCIFERPNAKYIREDTIELITKDGKRVKLQAARRYFSCINATRPIPTGEGHHVKFDRTRQFAGAWYGVYATNNKREIRAIETNGKFGISEITKDDFEREMLNRNT